MNPIQRPCSKCNKPMTFALVPGGKGERTLRCLDCDGLDPLKSDEAGRWVDGPLKPPE
jgi:hypothetical protein